MAGPLPRIAVIALLMTLSCAIQACVIAQAQLPALDAVNFIAHAQWIERDGIVAALRADPSPPLFPLLILAVHAALNGIGVSLSWALVAQCAAAIPLVLCVVPVYRLAQQACGARAAAIAGLLFAVMTQVARVGGDALSDSAHLLFFCTALVALGNGITAATAWRRGAWRLAAGAAIGVALLARGEAWILVPALVLTVLCITPRPWSGRVRHCFGAGAAVLVGVALTAIGWLTPLGVTEPDDILQRLLARRGFSEDVPLNLSSTFAPDVDADSRQLQLADGEPMQFGRKDPTVSIRFRGFGAALARFAEEMLQSWQYLVGLLAAVGCWRARRERRSSIVRLHATVFGLHAAALLVFAWQNGYLERRHLLPLVVVSLPWAARGVLELGAMVFKRVHRASFDEATTRGARGMFHAQCAAAAVVAVLLISTTLLPLHPGRAAHRQAAAWLLAQSEPGAVLDTVGHTAIYTGRTTYRHEIAPAALADPNLRFVVIETAELRYPSRRAATLQELLARFGTLTATFKPPSGRTGPEVRLYRWSDGRLALQQGLTDAR